MLTQKDFCDKGYFCQICRDKINGGGFRWKFMVNKIDFAKELNFECPQGKPWDIIEGGLLAGRVVEAKLSEAASPVIDPELAKVAKQRFEICKTCDKATEAGHKCSLHKACCFGAWRSKPESKCYDGKW